MDAELIGFQSEEIQIRRLEDGQVFTLPIKRLSSEDQEYLETVSDDWLDVPPPEPRKPFTGLEWPRRVGLPDNYDVIVIREDNQRKEYIYRTPNFEFRSDVKLARKVVREFGKIFEATYAAMKAFPLEWNPEPVGGHYVTRLFETTEDYYKAGGIINSGGTYRPSKREILTPLTSLGVEKSSSGYTLDRSQDSATLIHEITHQVHHDWLAQLRPWLTEGMAVYMESVPLERSVFRFDKRDVEEFVFRRSYVKESFHLVPLEKLMAMTLQEWNQNFVSNQGDLGRYYISAFLLVNYFLHHDGEGKGRRIYKYCREIESGISESEARKFLLGGRSYEALFKEMKAAYKREGIELINGY